MDDTLNDGHGRMDGGEGLNEEAMLAMVWGGRGGDEWIEGKWKGHTECGEVHHTDVKLQTAPSTWRRAKTKQVYADHAGKPQLDADDVRLAIQAKVNFSFSQPPPREVLLELARSRNKIPLPKSIAPPGSIPLPPEQDTLLSQNYQLLPALKPPTQTEEAEDEEEGANADAANAKDQRGNEQQQQPQSQSQGQRVSFQLNAVAAAAAKRPRMTIDQLNMG
ncbi:unnamed protein product [Triticum turgidum subsp. durum]|uniref:Transcription initiation factor TFIID subunit 9 n=1 Tax=Triticum turgidum subsp. durum TaxID=4567 RepID=A0A9R0RXQ7_TRITD|nr:unnamed protein product [Triticum turgidum subsp. durum]